MLKFSANLGFLWPDLPLDQAIRAAARAGFDAVECHWPYACSAASVRQALESTSLPMLSLNTLPGDTAAGEFGLCALPGRETQARAAIDRALRYAAAVGCRNVHLMAGRCGPQGLQTFLANLEYAADRADGIGLLIEPINHYDVPGYFLHRVEQAVDILNRMDRPQLRLMFDCYHVQRSQGDLIHRLRTHLGQIGHLQIAAAPGRDEPDRGEIAYPRVLAAAEAAGYRGFVGAEYKPSGATEDGLGWLRAWRA